MSLAVCVLISWFVIIILSLIPKKLSELDMVLLYFVNAIFQTSVFTLIHINFKWIDVSHSVEKSLADLVIRFVMFPLVFIIMCNVFMYSRQLLKWGIVISIALFFIFTNSLFESLGINIARHWNIIYTSGMYFAYAIFARVTTWGIVHIDRGSEGL